MEIVRLTSQQEFVDRAVHMIASAIHETIAQRGRCVLGLSGGSTPQPVYTALASDTTIDWTKLVLILLDERYVPPDHADSNVGMLMRTLLASSAARHASFLFPDTRLPLDECVKTFDEDIKGLPLDSAVLGMGEDGHVASLFPPLPPKQKSTAHALHTTTEHFAVRDRITVSMPVLMSAKQRFVLTIGEAKLKLIERIRTGHEMSLPAAQLNDERTMWIVRP